MGKMNKWEVVNIHHKAKKGGVFPTEPKKEEYVIEHDEVFYFWIESTLSIRAIDTDSEIRRCLLEKMGEEEADFYLSQRKKALKEGSKFKLVRYGFSDEDVSLESIGLNNQASVDVREFQILCWDYFGAIKSKDYKKGRECFNLIEMVVENHDEILSFQDWKATDSVIKSPNKEWAIQYAQYVLDNFQKKDGSSGVNDAVARAKKVIGDDGTKERNKRIGGLKR